MSDSPRRPSGPAQRRDFEVGRGKPPKHTQFKAGRSGNPKGRPRSRQNVRTVLEEALSEKIALREGDRVRRLSNLDALIRTTIRGALKGDGKAFTSLLALMRAAGVLTEDAIGDASPELSADDSKLLDDFLARNASSATSGKPSPSSAGKLAEHPGRDGE